jgi:tetraacyldisaccharide 4'-kinase
MREPSFWYGPPSLMSRLLSPLGALYGALTARRMMRPGARAGLPVICVGNYHVGGAGKTPATLAVADVLLAMGERPVVVSRGYGGTEDGPSRVDPQIHTAAQVGDEPLMMAAQLPVIVARDRVAGAALAQRDDASVVLLDDGFQNPALEKDLSLLVIDGTRGIGNGAVFPAGPLRAPLAPQIARTDALIVVGQGTAADGIARDVAAQGGLVVRASLTPNEASLSALRGKRVLAFAGIGDPARFFETLRAHGVDVAASRTFADHHPFTPEEIGSLVADAAKQSLMLVTTAKDMARIRSDARLAPHADGIAVLAVTMMFADEPQMRAFLTARVERAR